MAKSKSIVENTKNVKLIKNRAKTAYKIFKRAGFKLEEDHVNKLQAGIFGTRYVDNEYTVSDGEQSYFNIVSYNDKPFYKWDDKTIELVKSLLKKCDLEFDSVNDYDEEPGERMWYASVTFKFYSMVR